MGGSKRLAAAFRVGLRVAAAAALLFVGFEATARYYLFGWAGLDLRRAPITRGLAPPGMWAGSPAQPYRMFNPNLDLFANLVHLRTNSQGLRDREYPLEKPADSFRVAVMGSSYTVPNGVEIEDAYHSLLEQRLSASRAPRRYEFINFATIATGPDGVLHQLTEQALRYDPDLILIGATRAVIPYYLLEWRRSPDELPREFRWPPLGMIDFGTTKALGWRSYFVDLVRARSNATAAARSAIGKRPAVPLEPPPTGPRPDDVVAKLAQIGRRLGIPIVVCRLEYYADAPEPVEQRFADRVVAEGMHYVDTREAFRGTQPSDFWIHRLDRHPDARGHAIFADVIQHYLESNDLLGR